MTTSIRDGLKPIEDPVRISCIRIVRDYGDYEVEFDVCIEL
ncbi:hypothetical protein [Vulcanisaeta sp. JCM 14467]|nr:hypothetical protein [Vulcanisaeta sp. JCM 14467]